MDHFKANFQTFLLHLTCQRFLILLKENFKEKGHYYGLYNQDHVWTIMRQCLTQLYFQTSYINDIFKNESTWYKALVYGVSTFWDHVRAMFGPCWDHVLPSSATRPARALKFSRLSQHGLSPMSMVCQLFGAMLWPCVDYVWPKSTSRPARALLFQRQI